MISKCTLIDRVLSETGEVNKFRLNKRNHLASGQIINGMLNNNQIHLVRYNYVYV